MLLPNKYRQLKDSYIYKIDLLLGIINREIKPKYEDILFVLENEYKMSYGDTQVTILFGYAMKIININEEGVVYVESTSDREIGNSV